MSDERTPELNIDEKYSERLEYLGRIAALERDLAAAQARIERYEALLNRCSDACKVVPVLVRNGEHISLPTHIEKAIGKDRHEGCPRAKAERGDDLAHLRERANALLHQIDIGDYVDSEGHALKNNIAVLTLMKALTNV